MMAKYNTDYIFLGYSKKWLSFLSIIFVLLSCSSHVANNEAMLSTVNKTNEKILNLSDTDKEKYKQVREHLVNKQYPEAESKLNILAANYPNHSGIWANLGLIYSETNRLEKAQKALKKSIAFNNKNTAIYMRLALVYKRQGEIIESLKMYKESIVVDPDNAKAHYNIAILYDLYLEDLPSAISHVNKYIDLTGADDKTTTAWLKQLQRDNRKATKGNN